MRLAAAIQGKNQLLRPSGVSFRKRVYVFPKTLEFLVNLVRFMSTILVNFQFKRST
jgi:hypothetical protein